MVQLQLIRIILLLFIFGHCQSRRIPKRNREMREKHSRRNVEIPTSERSTEVVLYDEIYSEWSPWGRCTRRCKEVRWRPCADSEFCGDSLLKEERPCSGGRCTSTTVGPVIIPHSGEVIQKGKAVTDLHVLIKMQSILYGSWSSWSTCGNDCRTRRQKDCRYHLICGNSVIEEDAKCYQKGTTCEQEVSKENKLTTTTEESEPLVDDVEDKNDVKQENPLGKYQSICGVSSVPETEMALRIIGGRQTVKGRWPWQVAILNRFKEPFCGGTIIGKHWVLTAAHCIRKRLYIRAGEHDLVEKDGIEQEIRVDEAILHPNYDTETVDNDIALLKLRTSLHFDDFVKPACLPESREVLPLQARAFILGWGKRRNGALYGTDVLHEAEVPVVDLEDCKTVYPDYFISSNMLCAGYRKGRVDSCAGDSGGPLLYRSNNTWAIYGVTSFGEGCGKKGKYGIYAKVSNYIGWIQRTVTEKLR